uniref:SH3 domain-binding protein 5 n=1 Tax=Astyanax mexicanus TaxID=7994 RepID=A0A8B9HGT8_ASTMX
WFSKLSISAYQGELEKLNQSTDDINRCETELEVRLRIAQLEAQKATQDFQRATEVLRAAKETIALAEQRLLEDDKRQFDSAWQEMLNHATQRVMEAEQTKTRSELLHKETAARYTAQLKKNVDDLQAKLTQAKGEYKTALKNLEMISDEIHERRRSSTIGPRERGVGAEGDGVSGDDLVSFKIESDGISMTSESFEDENCSTSAMSEEDSETQSTCSLSSGPSSPLDLPCPFSSSSSSSPSSAFPPPSSRPCSLELPSTVSLSDFGLISPILGPRSECSGASSPECDLERGDRAEGAEAELNNALNNNSSISSMKNRFRLLSLKRGQMDNAKVNGHNPFSIA